MYVFLALYFGAHLGTAQQVADHGYNPAVENPAYGNGQGPRIGIDEAHNNYHTATGRYAPFAKLVEVDGYQVSPLSQAFTESSLEGLDILVIANPLHVSNNGNWKLPTPSAFSDAEIAALHKWVEEGESLFLILDHMPFPGAGGKLAESFGFKFSNGFAYLGNSLGSEPDEFKPDAGLMDCVITRGRNKSERITKMVTFTGSAFQPPEEAIEVLVLPENSISKEPVKAWEFVDGTNVLDVSGWCQGAIMEVGEGRIAVFGEAASFSAQFSARQKRRMGMAAPFAEQNQQFLLNILHWLSDLEGL
ncbi:MAG: hypothetical protein P8L44_16160 [Opitutales bacterium]|nr:GldG family protein [Opitutales bacterium]MDG2169447.1 hypothetical protein [Opitutales bacterium]